MAYQQPDFTIGVEEEYLLVDKDSLALAPAPDDFMSRCVSELEGQASPEFLACQIEIGTKVCASTPAAREDLKRLRSCVARVAGDYNLSPIAASCHPFSDWKDQTHTDRERYQVLKRDLAGVGYRMLISGMHVHVGIPAQNQRIDLMNQLTYFLPHLLAMSGSSPFWQGRDTGMNSYRLTVFDNLPRTGLPPQLASWGEYERSVDTLIETGVIEDSSKIWWDLRPSAKYPTIESRICDVSPSINGTLSLAALTQCLTRMLWRLARSNQRWRMYDNFLISENRWRAQRYGVSEGLIDFGAGQIIDFKTLLDEMIELVQEDADTLGALQDIENARDFITHGTASDRQRDVYNTSIKAGKPKDEALRDVVTWLTEAFHDGL